MTIRPFLPLIDAPSDKLVWVSATHSSDIRCELSHFMAGWTFHEQLLPSNFDQRSRSLLSLPSVVANMVDDDDDDVTAVVVSVGVCCATRCPEVCGH